MKKLFVPLIMACALSGAGCKKEKDAKPVCQLSVITPGLGSVFNLYYDDQQRMSMVKKDGKTISIEYKADSIIATEKENLSFVLRKRYKLNAQGLPVVMRLDINESGSQWWQYNYEYKGTELVRSVETFYANAATTVIEYSWRDGNLAGFKYGLYEWKFEYYEDKLRMLGDGFQVQMLMTGNMMPMIYLTGAIEIVRNKHLLKKMISIVEGFGSAAVLYEYNFDKEGKMLQLRTTNTDNQANIFNLQYQCN